MIRTATLNDFDAVISFDPIGENDPKRQSFLRDSMGHGECLIIERDGKIAGYGVLNYRFFGYGFVSLIVTHPDFRRQGIASRLLKEIESCCMNPKLFLTTNQSNKPMQALAEKLGYIPSGVIENIDEGDPELVYFKRLS